MPQTFRASALVPSGFVVDEVTSDGASALITVRSIETASICSGCGTRPGRVHSRYERRLADLPIAGRSVRLMVRALRLYCRAVLCGRRVFTEHFDDDVIAPWARRTARLDHIVHHLGLALGGRPAASFARVLKTLRGLTPYEFICKSWTTEPELFTLNSLQQMPGVNI